MGGDGWTERERKVARRAFDRALQAELAATIAEAQARAAQVKAPDDLWALEEFLGQRRRDIDRTYDYRYSQLTVVFARLIESGRLGLQDLDGLHDDKLLEIRRFLTLWGVDERE